MANSTQPQQAPQILDGTWLAEDETRAAAFVEQVEQTSLRSAVWSGAFATNVWGGRYEMEGLLAEGGQGTTFHGLDLKTGAQVVVKLFDVGNAKDWKSVELFEREVATLKKLEHDQIPSFMEVIEDEASGTRALVMTRVLGENLRDTLESEGSLSEARLWRVLIDVVSVLSFVHQQGLVHRDLKPRNLIRQEKDGEIHLVDFGGVARVDGQKGSTVVGTFGYMAPEQLYGSTTYATDLYALGATLLTLATGKEPEELPRTGLAIDVDKAAPHLSVALRGLLSHLLEPDPLSRPVNATEVAQSLQEIYEESKGNASSSQSTEAKNKAKSKNKTKSKGRMNERAETDAVFDADDDKMKVRQQDIDNGLTMVGGTLHMVLSIFATVTGVVVGEVLLPLLISILVAFSQGETREKLLDARRRTKKGAKKFRASMQLQAQEGARTMNDVGDRMRDDDARRKKRKAKNKFTATKPRQKGFGRRGKPRHGRKR